MRQRRILQIILLITVFSLTLIPEAFAGGVGDKGSASFTYDLGTYSDYYNIVNMTDDGVEMGSIAIYDDGSYIYIWVGIWSKPYLAYGELDKDGDGVIDADKYEEKKHGGMKGDKNKDGAIDKHDLGSDGVTIEGLGDPHGSGKDDSGYRWKVDSNEDGSPKKYRDPEINVPSWTDDGILVGPIVYIATIPIPSGETSFSIDIEVHASPPKFIPSFVVPEYPLGTLAAIVAMLIALVLTTRARSVV